LGTRICPSTAANLSPVIDNTSGPFTWNSDHCPLFINVAINLPQSYNKPPSWTFHEKKWPQWNLDLESSFSSANITDLTDPSIAHSTLHSCIIETSQTHFNFCDGEKFCAFYSSHGNHLPAADEDDDNLSMLIEEAIANDSFDPLNSPITSAEVDFSLSNLRSKAFGSNFIHNDMLRNISPINRKTLLFVWNFLLSSGYVPRVGKQQ